MPHPKPPLYLFKALVLKALTESAVASWRDEVASHTIPFPILELHDTPICINRSILQLPLVWEALLGHRSLCRMRAALIELGHIRGKHSRARARQCIFCDKFYSSLTLHVLGECDCWTALRSQLPGSWSQEPKALSRAVLTVLPGAAGFAGAATLALAVDSASAKYWLS
jgi:hypothetical protein